jgi:hypothetical protein
MVELPNGIRFIGPRSPRPWRELKFDLPSHIPTMITREEIRYLRWLTEALWDDSGHVVEMGPWLGGSTFCLAAGMRARSSETRHKLHVFDSFEWREFMSERSPLKVANGASFEPHFQANLAPFADLVVSKCAVLPDELLATDASLAEYRQAEAKEQARFAWRDGPIQLLFVDGAKSWTGMRHLLLETAPSWIPGKTILVCQDYKHWGCYWVTALTELLSHRLRVIHVIQRNTVAFVVQSQPSAAELASLPSFEAASVPQTLQLIESAALRLSRQGDRGGASVVRLGKVPFLVHQGQAQNALREFRRQETRWLSPLHERALADARQWLSERLGQPLEESKLHGLSRVALSLGATGKGAIMRSLRARHG